MGKYILHPAGYFLLVATGIGTVAHLQRFSSLYGVPLLELIGSVLFAMGFGYVLLDICIRLWVDR